MLRTATKISIILEKIPHVNFSK